MVSNAAGGRNCKWEFRNFTKASAPSILPQPAFSMLRPKRAGAGVVDRWQPPDWKPPPRSLEELPTTTIPGPLGKGMISGLCIARTGLKDKKGRVLNEVGLFLGQG